MSYNKHKWVNNVDAVDEDKMNNIENGIANAVEKIENIEEQLNPTNWINATLGSGISGIVRYAKIGRLVIVEIRELASTTNLTDTGAVIATGLPKSIASTLFVVSLMTATTTSDPNCRLQLSASGNITLFYDKMYAGSSSAQYYGQLVYISNE